jgi:hypothetical protein
MLARCATVIEPGYRARQSSFPPHSAGDIVAYQALRDMRTSIVADLVARGSQLPELITVTRKASLPSLVLAYQL